MTEDKPVLYIVRGLPGSGKSTFVRTTLPDCKHFEADMFFEMNGQYHWDPALLRLAHQWCFANVVRELRCGYDVAVSNTFTTKKEMQQYLDIPSFLNIQIRVIEVRGNFGTVHNVPDDTIARMRQRWQPYRGLYPLQIVDNTED